MSNANKIDAVSTRMMQQQKRISAVLPDAVTFVEFHTAFITACRKTPDIWTCTPESIFDAAIDSAIDGLPCDGKHAAIVRRNVNIGTRAARKMVDVACYTPMAYGIRKKIIESGAAKSIETTIVYANEYFKVTRGTDPSIEHEVLVTERGDWIAVYSVALLPNGEKTFEVMSRDDVMAVRDSAQTKGIWDKHETEMARKTVLRRHAKQLSGSQMMVDVEQRRLFLQIERQFTAAPTIAPPKPTRGTPAIEDNSHQVGITDFGSNQERETVSSGRDEHQESQEEQLSGNSGQVNESEVVNEDTGEIYDMPQSASEFDLWAENLKHEIEQLSSIEDIKELRRKEAKITAAAPEDVRAEVESLFTTRLTDLS